MKFSVNTRHRKMRSDFKLGKNPLFDELSIMETSLVQNGVPLTWSKAKNFSVWDEKGNMWIDLTSGIFVVNAGHSNPYIKKAIKKQLDADLIYAYNYPTRIKRDFVKKLLSLSPKHLDTVLLLNSGSEDMDLAYKLIKFYAERTEKKYIITFRGAYHGRGLSNDLISGNPEKAGWSGVKDENVVFLDFPCEDNAKFDPLKLPRPEEIAGFVVETFQGWSSHFYPNGFLNDLCAFAKQHGALVCFDELQSGFYRLGPIFGYMTYGSEIEPDIVCLGKGISSSLPISAVLTRSSIANLKEKADLHSTHSGNALCCAAALANIRFLSNPREIARRKETEKVFGEQMERLKWLSRRGIVKKVNVRGLIGALIFEDAKTASLVAKKCIEKGVLLLSTSRGSIKIAPPLTITKEALLEAFMVIKESIGEVCR